MAQLPEGSSPNFQEFNAKDLLRLLQTGTWEAKCFVLPEQIVIIRKNSMYIYIIYIYIYVYLYVYIYICDFFNHHRICSLNQHDQSTSLLLVQHQGCGGKRI